jgi:GMP synthase-like glutamine amidotransferase
VRVLSVVHELDAGSGVFGDFPTWVPSETPPPDDFDALMVFGGSMHVDQNDKHRWLTPEKAFLREQLERGTPILGVCLGSQLLAEAAGASPYRSPEPEIGWYDIEITQAGAADPVLGPLAPSVELFEWHHYVAPLPPGAVELARTPACVHAEVTRKDLFSWLDGWHRSEAPQTGLDPERIRAASEQRIEGQNEVGRGIAGRFLAEAARATAL